MYIPIFFVALLFFVCFLHVLYDLTDIIAFNVLAYLMFGSLILILVQNLSSQLFSSYLYLEKTNILFC